MQRCKCYAKWHDCGETFRKLRTVGRATVHWYVQLAGLTVVVDAYWRPQRACFIWPKNGWKIIRQIRTHGTAPSSPWTPHQIARGSWTLHDFKMTSNDLKNKGGQRGISITIRDGAMSGVVRWSQHSKTLASFIVRWFPRHSGYMRHLCIPGRPAPLGR